MNANCRCTVEHQDMSRVDQEIDEEMRRLEGVFHEIEATERAHVQNMPLWEFRLRWDGYVQSFYSGAKPPRIVDLETGAWTEVPPDAVWNQSEAREPQYTQQNLLRYASDEQLASLTHKDLLPMLQSPHQEYRTAAIRVAGKVGK